MRKAETLLVLSNVLFVSSLFIMENSLAAAEGLERFEARTYTDSTGTTLKYRLLKPKAYDAKQKYPLVLFLHGAGERGDNNVAQLVHGMINFANDAGMEKYPCFVVAPQCPKDLKWVDVDWNLLKHDMPEKAASPMRLTMEALDALSKEFAIDANRLYITGLSMGGYGTWDAIQRKPEMFAAAIPICGGGDPKFAKQLINIPIWAFHGDKDGAVKVERSRDMIKAIKDAGGSPKYTEYPGVGHDSWTATYKNPEVLDWLFAQKKK